MSNKWCTTFGKLKSDPSEIENIRSYFDLFKDDTHAIDDEQYHDLDIEDLFCFANRCITPVAEMLLYHKMRHLSQNNLIAADERTIERIALDREFRNKIEVAFSDMANVRIGSVSNLLNMSTHLSKWHRYFRFLPFIYLAVLFILWIFATPAFVQAGCVVFLLVNTLIHYWNKNYVETYIRPLVQLHKMRIAVIKLSRIEKRESSLNMDESIHEINHLSKKIGVFSLDRLMESEFSIIFYSIVELVKILFLIEPIYTNLILTKIHHINSHSRNLSII